MTSTLTTLNSHLNTLLEKQASIICNAEAFAKDLENVSMKELKQIASEWNVIPDNKTKKASYISALHIRYEEKNGLAEVNEQIEKLQFQIKCAEAQECANAQQKVIRVIRTIENEWWVGTEETFHTIYPNEGYEIHFTARPEKPDTCSLTSNSSILTQDVKIASTTYTIYGYDKEELEQETLVLTEAVHQANPLQGVTSFFSSLAVFSAHDVLPFDVIGDITLYEQLKSKWDAMNGDEKCQCEWCDAEPLQYQEELQHTIALHAHVVLQQNPLSYVDILPEGNITISTQEGTVTLSSREAYSLLETLYQAKDVLYQQAQQDEGEPTQKSELQQYAEKHLSEHIKEAGIILYTIVADHVDTFVRMGYPIRYLLPDETSPALFHSSNDAEHEFLAKYPDAEYIELDEMDEECKKREKAYRERHLLKTEEPTRHYLGTGLLSWPRKERITGRYGLVALFDEDWDQSPWQVDITSLAGKHGSLVAVLDGEEIELGRGECFTEQYYDNDYIGLSPDEYRNVEWLGLSQLHKVDGHITNKPVELWFVEQ